MATLKKDIIKEAKDNAKQNATLLITTDQNKLNQLETVQDKEEQDNSIKHEPEQHETQKDDPSESKKKQSKKKYPWANQDKTGRTEPKYNRSLALNAHYDTVLKYVCERDERSIRWMLNRIVTRELEKLKKQIEKEKVVDLNV